MSVVRFHSICDICSRPGEEYGAMFPACDGCNLDICPACASVWREDDGYVSRAVCHACAMKAA